MEQSEILLDEYQITQKPEEQEPNMYDLIEKQDDITAADFVSQPVALDEINILQNYELQQEQAYTIQATPKDKKGKVEEAKAKATLKDFTILRYIGKGACGKVFLVKKKDSEQLYAMKTMRKDFLLDKEIVDLIVQEKNVLEQVNHPFIVGMEYCFSTDVKIYFVSKFYRGGELHTHL